MTRILIAAAVLAASACAVTRSTLTQEERAALPALPPNPEGLDSPDSVIERSLVIAAPAARVYEILADVALWPEWEPNIPVTRAYQGRPLTAGDTFHQEPNGFAIEAEVLDAVPGRLLRWRGEGGGLVAVHSFRLVPLGPARTLVVNHEEFHGWFLPLVTWATDLGIGDGLETTLASLRLRAEGVATAER
jgi:hypothetical protein